MLCFTVLSRETWDYFFIYLISACLPLPMCFNPFYFVVASARDSLNYLYRSRLYPQNNYRARWISIFCSISTGMHSTVWTHAILYIALNFLKSQLSRRALTVSKSLCSCRRHSFRVMFMSKRSMIQLNHLNEFDFYELHLDILAVRNDNSFYPDQRFMIKAMRILNV